MKIEYFTDKFRNKIKSFIKANYEPITVKSGDINFYYKCHLVATHYAERLGHNRIALVLYEESDTNWPIVHMVNYDGKFFIDNCLGEWVKNWEFRFIRWISKDEFFNTPSILRETQKTFSEKASFFERLFANIDI